MFHWPLVMLHVAPLSQSPHGHIAPLNQYYASEFEMRSNALDPVAIEQDRKLGRERNQYLLDSFWTGPGSDESGAKPPTSSQRVANSCEKLSDLSTNRSSSHPQHPTLFNNDQTGCLAKLKPFFQQKGDWLYFHGFATGSLRGSSQGCGQQYWHGHLLTWQCLGRKHWMTEISIST